MTDDRRAADVGQPTCPSRPRSRPSRRLRRAGRDPDARLPRRAPRGRWSAPPSPAALPGRESSSALADDDNGHAEHARQTVSEVSERASLLVREEIELAKTEISEKVSQLAAAPSWAIAAGVFVVVGAALPAARRSPGASTDLFGGDQVYLAAS